MLEAQNYPIELCPSCAAVSRRLHSAVTMSARMKQRASEEMGAIWAEIEADEQERDTLAEMGEGGGAGRLHAGVRHLHN